MPKRSMSPVGSTAEAAARGRAQRSGAYRRQRGELAGYREIAWLLIRYRMDEGLTQEELAERVGTSYSQISRIESGRHKPSLETLRRIGEALGRRLVIGFEKVPDEGRRAKPELIAL